jgi:anti-sigma-K factor RskA
MNYDRPELRDRLAAEYVLGTLHGHARRRFQRLIKSNVRLRVAVEVWEQRLIPMGAPLSVPAPAADVWKRIEARVAPGARSVTAAAPQAREGLFARWPGWRTVASLAAGVCVGIGAMLVVPALRPPPQQSAQLPESYAGFLQDAQGNATMLVSSLRHGSVVDIKVLRPIAVNAEQMLVLWALPKDASPFPLGVVPATGKGQLTLSGTSEKWLLNVAELAASVEPKANTPGTTPSVPFVIRGPCAKFW